MIHCETAGLRAAVEFLRRRITERRNTIPILSCVVVRPGVDGLTLSCSDLDVWADIAVEAAVSAEFQPFAMDVYALGDVLKKAAVDTVTMIHDDGRVRIESGRACIVLPTLPPDDFPMALFDAEAAHSFEMPAATLVDDLKRLQPFISTEDVKQRALCGIAFLRDGQRLRVAATNGSAASIIDRPIPCGAEAMPDSIIPAKSVKAMRSALKGRGLPAVQIAFSRNRARITLGPITLTTKLIDAVYPDIVRACLLSMGDDPMTPLPLPDIEPRLARTSIEAVTKNAAGRLTWQRGDNAVIATSDLSADWFACLYLGDRAVYSKGFHPQGDSFEYQDDDGVWHCLPLAVNASGAIDLSKETIAVLHGPAVSAPVSPAQSQEPAPATMVAPEPVSAPEPAPTPEIQPSARIKDQSMSDNALSAAVADLSRRLALLERAQGGAVYDRRACPARLRMIRRYLQMRAQRDLDSRALDANRVQYQAMMRDREILQQSHADQRRYVADKVKAKRQRTAQRLTMLRGIASRARADLVEERAAYRALTVESDAMRADLVRLQPLANALAALIPAQGQPVAPPVADAVPPRPSIGLVTASGLPLA